MACTCAPCVMCRGTGTYWVDMAGRVIPHIDDLGDLVMCDECDGSGIEAECDYCRDQRERDEDAQESPQ